MNGAASGATCLLGLLPGGLVLFYRAMYEHEEYDNDT
jgi:hypothetical protein